MITITNDIKAHFGLLDFPYSRTIYNGVFKASEANFIYPKEKYFYVPVGLVLKRTFGYYLGICFVFKETCRLQITHSRFWK